MVGVFGGRVSLSEHLRLVVGFQETKRIGYHHRAVPKLALILPQTPTPPIRILSHPCLPDNLFLGLFC
jgi:hypothetical protein